MSAPPAEITDWEVKSDGTIRIQIIEANFGGREAFVRGPVLKSQTSNGGWVLHRHLNTTFCGVNNCNIKAGKRNLAWVWARPSEDRRDVWPVSEQADDALTDLVLAHPILRRLDGCEEFGL